MVKSDLVFTVRYSGRMLYESQRMGLTPFLGNVGCCLASKVDPPNSQTPPALNKYHARQSRKLKTNSCFGKPNQLPIDDLRFWLELKQTPLREFISIPCTWDWGPMCWCECFWLRRLPDPPTHPYIPEGMKGSRNLVGYCSPEWTMRGTRSEDRSTHKI
jgi:hypothetical protein